MSHVKKGRLDEELVKAQTGMISLGERRTSHVYNLLLQADNSSELPAILYINIALQDKFQLLNSVNL